MLQFSLCRGLRSGLNFSRRASFATSTAYSRFAILFPGQGAQYVGMGKDLYDTYPVARDVFEQANDTLGEDLASLMFSGDQDKLTLTANAQPAILITSIALFRVFESKYKLDLPKHCAYVLGHSLGEYSALVAVGALDLGDAIKLVRLRGQAMQESVSQRTEPTAMTALVLQGSSIDALKTHLRAIQPMLPSEEVAQLANINSSKQVVLSGTQRGVGLAVQELQARRLAARAIDLPVSAPFHCSLMAPAADTMQEALRNITFRAPILPIISNVLGEPVNDLAQFPELLVRQVTHTVQWLASQQYCHNHGIQDFISFGPGRALANLLKREYPKVTIQPIATANDIKQFCP
ncbi:hypothetical protein IWQ61_005931 [Dispira simplex]|nr:hypothetical protein IWQ61_005931 [Dispira simplex]